jgi:transposase
MPVAALPDLNVLPAEALRVLILTQHQELITKDEQLLFREREIEHLKLLLSKLHRMQFGRKSEKLARQIEQLELRLEELQSNAGEKEPKPPEPASVPASWAATATKTPRRAWPDHLPRQTRRHDPKEAVCPQCQGELRKLGEDVSEMLEYVPGRETAGKASRPGFEHPKGADEARSESIQNIHGTLFGKVLASTTFSMALQPIG